MKHRLAAAFATACVSAGLSAPAAHAAGPNLAQAADARFPDRAFVLTLPTARRLTAGQVSLRENGRAVPGLRLLTPERPGGARFGSVLAIDDSKSMRGRPLRAALSAARTFVRHRGAGQPVAVVAFAGDVRVVVPFTTDARAIDRGLASIAPVGGGSRILDGAGRALALIRSAHISAGSVVLLSDGGDHGSRATLAGIGAEARAVGARLFAVGLRSGNANFGTLNLLAADGGGEFSAATSLDDLARIYGRLGARLANQYVLQYRSPAAPGRRVAVEARVDGMAGTARAAYTSPALQHAARAPFHRAPLEAFWITPGAAVLISIVAAALVGLALWVVVRWRRGSLVERLSAFVVPATPEGPDRGAALERLVAFTERVLDGRDWWTAFQERMDVARIQTPPARLVAWLAAGTLASVVLLTVATGNGLFGLLGMIIPVGAKAMVERRAAKQRKLFGDQLPDNLQVIASAMRAGHSFSGALAVVVDDAQEPTRRELQRVIADEQLGQSLEEALGGVVRRMQNRNLSQVAVVAALQHETGGNTAEVLDRVTEAVRERMALQRMVSSLTAQGRMSRWVLTALPCALLALITAVNPSYTAPLYATPAGRTLLGLAAVMVCAGSFVIKRIVDIKV